ncbi:cytochrome c oxidase subunit 3 [Tanticharoenia sakaeratensis]|jgi:cytochrome o ubiquinol oxidase subunit III|uniref:Cytochrome bo(3) ubiquinol oxidase subunit 3 n=1 Tax=Tanticharoenia sakaeratensis NBRC 103193 TaxID=1231623 RepID=A0A0D6MIN7_9PROT|nr:cytochrome c oxidase subunit 3 [Tanticharoenia sakaeratensis]GAN53524.1 cytochrome o ubiquinol oxidase subunit III [Tanticharoenia sakaeratensis NBRC 103193]GBQ17657.1 cytochrome o ubiquinol oxidase subunit III [Tanticharoenia sakaeratensis NBRC 103193]
MSGQVKQHPGLNLHREDAETRDQTEEVLFGFWVFLMSDLVLFSLLFATYGTMLHSMAGGPGPKQLFDIRNAGIETVALLLSTFSFGQASLAMKYDDAPGRVQTWLLVTLGLGLVFLGYEIYDFVDMIGKGGPPSRSGYLSSFFALVGTHGLHVTCGCVWIIVMIAQVRMFGLDTLVKTRLLRLGLFWHFLDVMWVGIFSVVYLQGLVG